MSTVSDADLTNRATYRIWIQDVVRYGDLDPNEHVNNGAINAYFNRMLNEGLHGIVLEIRDIDDYQQDDHVVVGIYSTLDKPLLVNNKIMPDSSFAIAGNPRWHNQTVGRIDGGVLVTDPMHLTLNMEWAIGGEVGATEEYDMRKARFRLTFQEDGGIQGLMGAYQPLDNVYSLFRSVGAGVSAVAGVDCAAEFKTLVAMADGDPDPETGQCTTISLAYEVVGQSAFIIRRDELSLRQ